MTQRDLALRLNVTDKAVSKWERGIGYPEVTTIPLLAELLGVSASEIILGEDTGSAHTPDDVPENSQADTLVLDTAEYVEHLQEQKISHTKDIAFICLSGALLLGMFVCGLCNYIVSARFDWSLYVFGSAVLVWLVVAPLLKCGRYRSLFSLAGLSIAIVPLLLLIEYLSPAKDWVAPFALPITIIALVSLWLFVLLSVFVKTGFVNRIAFALVLFGVADNLLIQHFVGSYLQLPSPAQDNPASAIVSITCAFIAVCLFAAGTLSRKRSR